MRGAFTMPGDPIPYTRMTQGQRKLLRVPDARMDSMTRKVQRRIQRHLTYQDLARFYARRLEYARRPKKKVYLNVTCYFRTGTHGDCENVRKGIQDALFEDDKMVAGGVDFFYDQENPRAEVEIVEEG